MKLSNYILIKVNLILFLNLFILLFYFDSTYEMPIINISNIDDNYLNKKVKIEGKIIEQNKYEDMLFLKIYDSKYKISGIVFNSNFRFNQSLNYYFEGKITKYNHELEIIIEKIYT